MDPKQSDESDSPSLAANDTTVTNGNEGPNGSNGLAHCAICGSIASHMCPQCAQDFCENHRCVVHSEEFETRVEPIIDEDGTEHRGKRIRLVGEGWPNRLRMISGRTGTNKERFEMPDEELRDYIKEMQELLKECIRGADFARISIAHAEYELDYREHSRYVAAMKRRGKTQGAILLGQQKKRARVEPSKPLDAKGNPIPPDILALMKAFNLTYELALTLKASFAKKQ